MKSLRLLPSLPVIFLFAYTGTAQATGATIIDRGVHTGSDYSTIDYQGQSNCSGLGTEQIGEVTTLRPVALTQGPQKIQFYQASDNSIVVKINDVGPYTLADCGSPATGQALIETDMVNFTPSTPMLAIIVPQDNSTVTTAPLLITGGLSDTSSSPWHGYIDGQQLDATSGQFSRTINLSPGLNDIVVYGQSRAGVDSNHRTLHITYTPPVPASPAIILTPEPPPDTTAIDPVDTHINADQTIKAKPEAKPVIVEAQKKQLQLFGLDIQLATAVIIIILSAIGALILSHVLNKREQSLTSHLKAKLSAVRAIAKKPKKKQIKKAHSKRRRPKKS